MPVKLLVVFSGPNLIATGGEDEQRIMDKNSRLPQNSVAATFTVARVARGDSPCTNFM
jgi:hypothetical protein